MANQGFWRGLVQERNDLFCQFFDAFSAIVEENGGLINGDAARPLNGGLIMLRADAGAYLIYILGGGVAVVIACDGTRDTDVFRGFDDKNLVAEGVQAGFKENGGFEEEEWWID